jgi:hypothetical protein
MIMSNLCHCATVNQLLKWRKNILEGKSKYYPKSLMPLVSGMVQGDEIQQDFMRHHYEKRRVEYNKKQGTDFVKN